MFWSLELDRRPGEEQEMPALIPLMSRQMQGGLFASENELSYPFSSESRAADVCEVALIMAFDRIRQLAVWTDLSFAFKYPPIDGTCPYHPVSTCNDGH
jgi:hypothetical protein